MLRIPCPWCGPRDEGEFVYGGQAQRARPADPEAAPDRVWGEYLYMRSNPKGMHRERWFHAHGCRRWFYAVRDTLSERFTQAWVPGAQSGPTDDEPV